MNKNPLTSVRGFFKCKIQNAECKIIGALRADLKLKVASGKFRGKADYN